MVDITIYIWHRMRANNFKSSSNCSTWLGFIFYRPKGKMTKELNLGENISLLFTYINDVYVTELNSIDYSINFQ